MPTSKPKTVTSAQNWKKSQTLAPTPLEVPSGNVALVKPVGIEAFLAQGLIPNSLMPMMMEAVEQGRRGKKTPDEDVEKMIGDILSDPSKLESVVEMANAVTVYCVIEPRVFPIPPDVEVDGSVTPGLRDPDCLYVDEVDLEDKMFVLNFALGGTRSLEGFREEPADDVRPVPSGQSLVD